MKSRVIFVIISLVLGVTTFGAPKQIDEEIIKGVSFEVQPFLRNRPDIIDGNVVVFDDIILVVGKASVAKASFDNTRLRSRSNAKVTLLKYLEGFMNISQESESEIITADSQGRATLTKYSIREVKDKVAGKLKDVRVFGEWEKEGYLYTLAGVVYGNIDVVTQKVELKNYRGDADWQEVLSRTQSLHFGGVAPMLDGDGNFVLLVSAVTRKAGLSVTHRDILMRSRALREVSDYVKGLDLNSSLASFTKISLKTTSDDEQASEPYYYNNIKKYTTAVNSSVTAMQQLATWESADGKDEIQVYILSLNDIE